MADRGVASPPPPPAAYEPIWCAWGYERDCTVQLITDTLPKVHDLGLRWAVIDDGWQSNVGDWTPNRDKYPRADADMSAFARTTHETKCPYKGTANYFTLKSGADVDANAVWTYETPLSSVAAIKEHLAFYPDKVEITRAPS